jgi:hypothetical protein
VLILIRLCESSLGNPAVYCTSAYVYQRIMMSGRVWQLRVLSFGTGHRWDNMENTDNLMLFLTKCASDSIGY